MANKIKIKRGQSANMPNLEEGELGFATDNKKVYIGSSDGNVCINPDSIYPRLDIAATSGTEVTVTDGNTTLTQTSTGIVSIYVPNFGTWTVTAGNYSKLFEIDTVKVYKIIAQALQDTSWDEINQLSMSGKASERWSIGDEKDIEVDGETLTLVILDFDHDDLTDGTGKAGITFGLKNLMTETRAINDAKTNVGGFVATTTYTWLQSDLLNNFPSALQSVIKTVNKKTSTGGQSTEITNDATAVFLFSEIEVLGITRFAVEGEGEHYPYFATTDTRKKRLANGAASSRKQWWLRSPSKTASNGFCIIGTSGNSSDSNTNYSYGVCFGFCV